MIYTFIVRFDCFPEESAPVSVTCLWTASLTARSCNLKQFFCVPVMLWDMFAYWVLYLSGTWSFVGKNCFLHGEQKPSPTSNQNQLPISSVVYIWETWETTKCHPKPPPLAVHQSNDSAWGRWQCLNCWSLYVVSHLMKHQAAASDDRPTCLSETTQPKLDGTSVTNSGWKVTGDFRCLGRLW